MSNLNETSPRAVNSGAQYPLHKNVILIWLNKNIAESISFFSRKAYSEDHGLLVMAFDAPSSRSFDIPKSAILGTIKSSNNM